MNSLQYVVSKVSESNWRLWNQTILLYHTTLTLKPIISLIVTYLFCYQCSHHIQVISYVASFTCRCYYNFKMCPFAAEFCIIIWRGGKM